MKDKKIEDLLNVLDETDHLEVKHIDPFLLYIRSKEIKPGNYKLDMEMFLDDYTNDRNYKHMFTTLNSLGFKTLNSNKKYVYVAEEDKERLSVEYVKKISEKIYKY